MEPGYVSAYDSFCDRVASVKNGQRPDEQPARVITNCPPESLLPPASARNLLLNARMI
jgi:hypothetical protein